MAISSDHKSPKLPTLNLDFLNNTSLINVLILDRDGYILNANNTFQKTFDLALSSIYNKAFESILSEPSDFQSIVENIQDSHHNFSLINNSDNVYSVEIEIFPFKNDNETCYLALIRDFTKRKKLRKQVEKERHLREEINEELEKEKELGELKTLFVSIASHEFKTPLSGILSSIHLVRRYLETDKSTWEQVVNNKKIENHFDKIEESVVSLNYVLNDILSLNKLEDDKVIIHAREFNMVSFLNDFKSEMDVLLKTGQKIVLNTKGPETIYFDDMLLSHILNNLISNAIKYSHENQNIELTASIGDKTLDISVKDDGLGIPEKDQQQLFRRFFRAGNVSQHKGTGLGLSIVKRYVNLLNGQISFESEVNKGSIFKVKIPLMKK